MGHYLFRGSLGHQSASMGAGSRAEVDDMVGGEKGVGVVFHHYHGVTDVPQVLKGFQESGVVPGMKTDSGFVKHVKNTGKPAADLAGKPYALRLSTGEGWSGAVQGEVMQTHVPQELQPG